MRTWARIVPEQGQPYWLEITTDQNGQNDAVWLTTLIQCLRANLNESPFFGNLGVPAQLSVQTGVAPDYYVQSLQQVFAPYFASLILTRTASDPPTYKISIVSHQGAQISGQLNTPPIPGQGFIFGASPFGGASF